MEDTELRPDLITPEMTIEELLMWQFLDKIVTHNQGKVVTKAIRVPLEILALPCGCTREYGTPLWRVSLIDESGAVLPDHHVRHEFAGAKPCNKVFDVSTSTSTENPTAWQFRKLCVVLQKENSRNV